ncbi:MAG: undecaprenyl-phosphate glucose phosphotransferase [Calditrichaeota bacterium]|nr:MAG: undecaprenyl-phosphate glucose phosphotransferase [Calditrichota bacterium]
MWGKREQTNYLVPALKLVLDVLTIHAAVLLSYYLRFFTPLPDWFRLAPWHPPPALTMYIFFAWVACLVFLCLFVLFRSYRSAHFSTFSEDIPIVLKTCFLGLLITLSLAFLYRDFSYSRATLALFYMNANLLFLGQRYLFHRVKRRLLSRSLKLPAVALIGSAELIPRLVARIQQADQFHFRLCGYLSDRPAELAELPYLGPLEALNSVLEEGAIEGLLVAFHPHDHHRVVELLRYCDRRHLDLYYIPDVLDYLTARLTTMELNGLPLLQLKAFPLSGWQAAAKRVFDVVLSLMAALLFSPLMLMIAMLIKLTSPGPVLYRQRRISLDGREFTMLKFRTLHTSEDAESELVDVKPDDPRVTPLGRLLRQSGLDELPQLLNVLKGDMSLVGPRPERTYYVEQYRRKIPLFSERHRVRCGITGWAQVNGKRQAVPWEERIPYDLFYVQNWSLWLDVKILLLTVLVLCRGRRAI